MPRILTGSVGLSSVCNAMVTNVGKAEEEICERVLVVSCVCLCVINDNATRTRRMIAPSTVLPLVSKLSFQLLRLTMRCDPITALLLGLHFPIE